MAPHSSFESMSITSTTQSVPFEKEELKIAIIGTGGVGKSSITIQFVMHEKTKFYDPTIEDSYRKQAKIDDKVCFLAHVIDVATIITEIVDTAGQDEYKALRPGYMRACSAFIFVYDITNANSLRELVEFQEEILRVKEEELGSFVTKVPCVLVGNKLDLESMRDVSLEDAKKFAATYLHSCPVLESSAHKRVNIDEVFEQVVRELRKFNAEVQAAKEGRTLSAGSTKPRKSSGLFSSISGKDDSKSDLDNLAKFQKAR